MNLTSFEKNHYKNILFTRVMDFYKAEEFCYEVLKNLEGKCDLYFHYEEENIKMSEDMDRLEVLFMPREPRIITSGKFIRPADKASLLFRFNLESVYHEGNGSRYTGINVRAGFEEYPDITKEQYHNLSLFVEDVLFNMEEYAIKHFYMKERKKK